MPCITTSASWAACHSAWTAWCNAVLCLCRLGSAPSVAHHSLTDLPRVEETEETTPVMLWIDTAGCDMEEKTVRAGNLHCRIVWLCRGLGLSVKFDAGTPGRGYRQQGQYRGGQCGLPTCGGTDRGRVEAR